MRSGFIAVPLAGYRATAALALLAAASVWNAAEIQTFVGNTAAAVVLIVATYVGIREKLRDSEARALTATLASEAQRLAAERAERKALDIERHEGILRELAEMKAKAELNAELAGRAVTIAVTAAARAGVAAESTAASLADLQGRPVNGAHEATEAAGQRANTQALRDNTAATRENTAADAAMPPPSEAATGV